MWGEGKEGEGERDKMECEVIFRKGLHSNINSR